MDYKNELEKLNNNQREAVFDESNACIVNANVGSGKTTVLISKIIYLHYEKNVNYNDMVVLTFTNKAANEIKERLLLYEENLDIDKFHSFGTFHSVALHILRDVLPIEQLGYTKEFCVIEPEEELDIALQIIQDEKLTIKYKNRLKKRLEQEQASRYQDDLILLKELLQKEKIKQNKMSFTDLLMNATHLLKDASVTFRWIIIDEVQDSDTLQLEFMKALMKNDAKIFAVGDPNQEIYSWRGSSINVFYLLKEKYQARELTLPVNYRSSTSILEAAKRFLQNGGPLTGSREQGHKIIVRSQYNSFQEACYLADRINEIHEKGIPYKEIAIFYRLQNQSEVLEDVFKKNEIPYEVSLKKTIRDIPVLNWLIHILRFSLNQRDIASGIHVLSNKDYGERIKEKAAAKQIKECAGTSTSRDKEFHKNQGIKENNDLLSKMFLFRQIFKEVTTANESKLYEYFDLDSHLHPTASTYQRDKEVVETLLHIIVAYIEEKQLPFLAGLIEFINSSALYGVNILQNDMNKESDSVKLMTLHASKGLEFSNVFIIGVNYGLIPLQGKPFEAEDEERRLFFVGMTRAKDFLELYYYTNPDTYRTMPGESRFIRMIPSHLIQMDETKETEVNLQEMKRQILAEKEAIKISKVNNVGMNQFEFSNLEGTKNTDKIYKEDKMAAPNNTKDRKVSHIKYGIGTVVREDELMITVLFEGYGEKEFFKAFSELKEV